MKDFRTWRWTLKVRRSILKNFLLLVNVSVFKLSAHHDCGIILDTLIDLELPSYLFIASISPPFLDVLSFYCKNSRVSLDYYSQNFFSFWVKRLLRFYKNGQNEQNYNFIIIKYIILALFVRKKVCLLCLHVLCARGSRLYLRFPLWCLLSSEKCKSAIIRVPIDSPRLHLNVLKGVYGNAQLVSKYWKAVSM